MQYPRREYVGIGLASIVLLMVVLQTIGLLFGCLGYRASAKPTERSCMSNSGGQMLMA